MNQNTSSIKNYETEYEMLFALRDQTLLFNKLNPNNQYLTELADYLDNRITSLMEMIDDEDH